MCSPERISFWNYLVPNADNPGRSIFDRFSLEELIDKTVVSLETRNGKMSYTIFENPADLFRYIQSQPNQSRNFHEVILGYTHQKPRFDIDMTQDKLLEGETLDSSIQRVIDLLLESIIKILDQNNITLDLEKQVILTSSNSPVKRSYHLVLHELVHVNHLEAGAFYGKVVEESEDPAFLKRFLDAGIYSSNHSLRLLHNTKVNDYRPKIIEKSFIFRGKVWHHTPRRQTNNPKLQEFILFYQSLVNYSCYCEVMPLFYENKSSHKPIELPEGAVARGMKFLAADMGIDVKDLPFEVNNVRGCVVDLKRLRPSYCKKCDKVHEHVDPYLIISESEFYFHCRRVDKGVKNSRHIGSHLDGVIGNAAKFYDDIREKYEVEYFDVAALNSAFENVPIVPQTVITQPPPPTQPVQKQHTESIVVPHVNKFTPVMPPPVMFNPTPVFEPVKDFRSSSYIQAPPKQGAELLKEMNEVRTIMRPTRAKRTSKVPGSVSMANGKMPAQYSGAPTKTTRKPSVPYVNNYSSGGNLNFSLMSSQLKTV